MVAIFIADPRAQKQKCHHFDEIYVTGCSESCQNDNFLCSQWQKFHQNDNISISVLNVWTWMVYTDYHAPAASLHAIEDLLKNISYHQYINNGDNSSVLSPKNDVIVFFGAEISTQIFVCISMECTKIYLYLYID